jgi:hypothetical protein
VGYDTTVVNNGYDDAVAAASWTYPSVRQPGNWDDLIAAAPSVALMANVQCENCHGPQVSGASGGAHMVTMSTGSTVPMNTRISYGAEVCAQCHASGSDYNIVSQYFTTNPDTGFGHANMSAAKVNAVGTSAFSCARCHSAQGFVQYIAQLNAGNIGTLPTSLTDQYSADNIQPITCVACHDPHDATNPVQLRLYGNISKLPSGFAVYGLGKGALCVACHNSRLGAQTGSSTLTYLHEDGESYNSGNPISYSIPHQSTQGDVLMGRNAYFMGAGNLPLISQHASVTDSCVGCHMVKNPQSRQVNGETRVNEHVMFIRDENRAVFCSGCHATTDGSALAAGTDSLLQQLQTKMGTAIKTKVNGFSGGIVRVRAYDPATDYYSSTSSGTSNVMLDIVANPVTSIEVLEIHGQMGAFLTFANPVMIPFVDGSGTPAPSKSMTSFGVQLVSLKDTQATPVALYALSGNMIRAGWNYFLIQYDASRGIHNPTFATSVVKNALAKDLSN